MESFKLRPSIREGAGVCGIAGIFAYAGRTSGVAREDLLRMHEAMQVRGPDGEGVWFGPDDRVGLSHRRLAIIDPGPSGHQPMFSVDGRYCITFNGEIYNYRALRSELEQKGRQFRTNSDTEVILELYASEGAGCVNRMRGMFAFAIHDRQDDSLFLARDPFGIKPLYYANNGAEIRFASQVKALVKGGHVDTSPNAAGHVGFYIWGHVPDPHTLFRGIKALPAGSTMLVTQRGISGPTKYFDVGTEFALAFEQARPAQPASKFERIEELHGLLADSIRHHLVADVPVGVFLSAGLDSTTVAALASEAGGYDLQTITLGFNEYRGTEHDETILAHRVAHRYGAKHVTSWVSSSDFRQAYDAVLLAMDQPSIDGVNTYFVSRAAASAGMKVALSGLGGDELFGGYPSFSEVPLLSRSLAAFRHARGIGRALRVLSSPLIRRVASPKLAGLFEYGGTFEGSYLLRRALFMPWELSDFVDRDFLAEGLSALRIEETLRATIREARTDFQRVSALELSWYMSNQLLRDADWAGMAHSVEVRVPFVDVPLFRAVARMAASRPVTKTEMADAPARPLPHNVLRRKKTGFSIPVRQWLQSIKPTRDCSRGLRSWAREIGPTLPRPLRLLVMVSDAYGGTGGIAKFNRDMLTALCSSPRTRTIVAIPRFAGTFGESLPPNLRYILAGLGGKLRYLLTVFRESLTTDVNLVICGHINLLPAAWLAAKLRRRPLVLVIHGIDAWQPTKSALTNGIASGVDAFVSVSALTKERFVSWSGVNPDVGWVLPNSVDMKQFRPEPRDELLAGHFGVVGRTVVMTLGRLVSAERYKGFDEVLDVLPEIAAQVPQVAYIVAGDGNDRPRLEQKARNLGVADRVIFTGFVPEQLKRSLYNLADAYAMPSRGEGFGIVLLEALACGVPVVASRIDGGKEALRDGKFGTLVDPGNRADVRDAIISSLGKTKAVPEGLEYFSFAAFERRVHHMIDSWSLGCMVGSQSQVLDGAPAE